MRNINYEFILKYIDGIAMHKGILPVTGINTDSRSIKGGDLFFALKGENFDGHEFITQAITGGAAGVVVSDSFSCPDDAPYSVIQVDDTLTSLQDLAAAYRQSFSAPVVAVTGSVGKTTTKDLVALCLSDWYLTLKTKGNYNNEIGLPLTLFDLREKHQVAVVEMGMRAPMEIHRLGEIVKPYHAIITNVEPVHMETMGSLQNIARAKCEILSFVDDDHFALINGDQPLLLEAAKAYSCKTYLFGYDDHCDIQIKRVESKGLGIEVELKVFDRCESFYLEVPAVQLAADLAAAVGMAYLMGVDLESIKAQLISYEPSDNRLKITHLSEGGTIINDTYNANPISMAAALEACKKIAQGKDTVAVLGDMFELGTYSADGHRLVGQKLAQLKFDSLVAIGENAQHIVEGALQQGMEETSIHYFKSQDESLEWLQKNLKKTSVTLFKASRGMHLEKLILAWLEE
ncbi:MAG: UDP-N-acetylmuramoyl-tripeptide--D-alanyl-D-alanine ligase [Bacillota bacterium]|nr:UDP-N-acetylmuramoyl-tripeptide--D-alanyl-D-alanine ligase [Bacillota bacterium]